MAKPTIRTSNSYRLSRSHSNFFPSCIAPLILSQLSRAQVLQFQPQPSPPDSPTSQTPPIDPFLPANPTDGDAIAALPSAVASSRSIPSHTDNANYASQNPTGAQGAHVLDYYFLLLAIFVIVVALVCWSLARRRHKRLTTSRSVQQSALAQDLRTWPTGSRGGRWRFGAGEVRREEGLDERGEAPPPYLKEPDRVYHETGAEGMELHVLSRAEGKPPDYEEGHSRR